MPKVEEITGILEKHFPLWLAEGWDNCGLQIGCKKAEANKIVVALDMDEGVLDLAIGQNADMVITHHPLFFKGIKSIDYSNSLGRIIKKVINAGISVYSAHTNLDAGEQGLNQLLAERLGLCEVLPLGVDKQEEVYKLVVFVPTSHVEELRQAMCNAGAGHIGAYSDSSFRVRGIGTFQPLEGSNPFIGKTGALEEVEEYRLETIVLKGNLERVVRIIKEVHPYEEVAYDIYRLNNPGKIFSLGRKGRWPEELSLWDSAERVKKSLNLEKVRVVGDLDRRINTVAVVSGSGASLIDLVLRQRTDLFITGDLKYHEAMDAQARGLAIIDAGHQATEEIVVPYLTTMLQNEAEVKGWKIDVIAAGLPACIKLV